jgi:glycerol-3-phosphate cytidylyltransferase
MLAEAKARCDFLIVGLLTDPTIDRDYKNKPAQTTLERWVQVAAVEFVDMIIPFDTERDLEDMLNIIQPNIRIVGEEYRDVEFTGKHIDGIEIYYNPRSHSFSTSELRERIVNAGNVKPTQTRSTAPKE